MKRRDGSSVLDYELEALTVAELEGFKPGEQYICISVRRCIDGGIL